MGGFFEQCDEDLGVVTSQGLVMLAGALRNGKDVENVVNHSLNGFGRELLEAMRDNFLQGYADQLKPGSGGLAGVLASGNLLLVRPCGLEQGLAKAMILLALQGTAVW